MLLAVLGVVVVAAAAAIFVLPSSGGTSHQATPPTATTSIHAPSFTAPVPAGWTVRARSNAKGAHQFQLGSTNGQINGVDIGPPGMVAVTITESQPEALTHAQIAGKPASSYSPMALLPHIVGQPAKAEGVQAGERPSATRLAGAPAGEEAFFYGYKGHSNVQVDVIAEHAGRLFLIELDGEPRLQATSRSALAQILGGWRFS